MKAILLMASILTSVSSLALDYAQEEISEATLNLYRETAESTKDQKFSIPRREMAIIVTNEGYYPKSLAVFRGERVKFYITNTSEKPSCFVIKEKGVFLSANKGSITEAEVYFDKPGTIEFYCPSGVATRNSLGAHRTPAGRHFNTTYSPLVGKLQVLDKPSLRRKYEMKDNVLGRGGIWMPKEY